MRTTVLLLTLARLLVIAGAGPNNDLQGCITGFCKRFNLGQFRESRPTEVRQYAPKNNYPKLTKSFDFGNSIADVLMNNNRRDRMSSRYGEDDGHLVSFQDPNNDLAAKCFRQLGPKFTKMPAVHFFSYKSHSPSSRHCGQNIEFELSPTNGQLSTNPELDSSQIKKLFIDSNVFNASVETYFITHGYSTCWSDGFMCEMKDLILDKIDANVFLVDWSGGSLPSASPLDYARAVSDTAFVGALVGEFARSLVELSGQPDPSNYHLIGHSLGAHISGFIGYYLDGKVGHITGLDPAGPCFTVSPKLAEAAAENGCLDDGSRRLSRQSARSVLVLHTDTSLFGLKQNCGHYDVYVNGGYKQPDCVATHDDDLSSIQNLSPFKTLLVKFEEFVKNQLPCRHGYACKVFNQVLGVLEGGHPGSKQVALDNNMNQCYSVAYQCRSWRAFRAGECGFCRDQSQRCVFIGIRAGIKEAGSKVSDEAPNNGRSSKSFARQTSNNIFDASYANEAILDELHNDDDFFNDEDDEHSEKVSENLIEDRAVAEHSHGKHFIRSGRSPMTCIYNYQIVVAVNRKLQHSAQSFYYLQIPLERSGALYDRKGKRLHDRIVQVSHKVPFKSAAYNYLKTTYMNSLGSKRPLSKSEELDFYTALITFEPVTDASKCASGDQTNGAGRKDKWRICVPLHNIQEARLWSFTEADLKAVAWVGMNYMSGLDYEHRLSKSYLFRRNSPKLVQARDEIRKSHQQGPSGNKPNCLLSLVDTKTHRDARQDFKCDRSHQELTYGIKLKPFRLTGI